MKHALKLLSFAFVVLAARPVIAVDLPMALQAALASDPTLASAAANRDAAAEGVALAGARLLPQLSLQYTTQHLEQTTTQANGSSEFLGRTVSTQLSLRQGLYRPRDWVGVDIARQQSELGSFRHAAAQSDLWTRTVAAWIDVLAAQAVRDVYVRTLASATLSAEQEQRRFGAGEGTRDAMVEAAAQRAGVRAQLAEAGLDLRSKLQAFNLLTRLEVLAFDAYQLPAVTRLGLLPEFEQALLDRILATNPDLAAMRAAEAVSERRLAQASADHLPTLDLIGAVNRAQNDSTNTLGARYHNTQIGVQLVVPIFAGGGVNAAQRQAAAAYVAAQADREAMVQRLRTQFVSDWNAQTALRERGEAAGGLVEAAREQRWAIELGIKKGLRTWAEFGAADQSLARRESDLVSLTGQLIKTQARLLSLLPATDSAWDRWALAVSGLARL